ncbi:MAG TPA: Clp protease N-terminal domain-containing protein [Acidimicrobiales bacterium]|nr:Clp protease N-terminal domain-containing protein [Acidimicrobiales bacterium]
MFERFTDRARRVIVVAQDAAREMGHQQIKPGHLLVALTEGDGVAAKAMAQSGVDGVALRARVAQRFESKPSAKKLDKVPFSPEAKKALEQSLRAALGLGHNYIGTEHLFLGVQREAERRGEVLDELLGVSAGDVRSSVMQMLGGTNLRSSMHSPATHSAMAIATGYAGRAPVTTGHLLAAMVADTDSQAARALAALGVTAEALGAALVQVPLSSTSDASPPAQSISITIGGTTTVISDPDVVAALQLLDADEIREVIKKAIGRASPGQAAG